MTAAPPLLAGAVKLTVACASPPTAVTLVGAPGTVAGARGEPAAPVVPLPAELVALTVKV